MSECVWNTGSVYQTVKTNLVWTMDAATLWQISALTESTWTTWTGLKMQLSRTKNRKSACLSSRRPHLRALVKKTQLKQQNLWKSLIRRANSDSSCQRRFPTLMGDTSHTSSATADASYSLTPTCLLWKSLDNDYKKCVKACAIIPMCSAAYLFVVHTQKSWFS